MSGRDDTLFAPKVWSMPTMGQPPPTVPMHLMNCDQGTAIHSAELVLSPGNRLNESGPQW